MTSATPEPATEAHSADVTPPLDAVAAFAHELHEQFGIDPDRVPLDEAVTLTRATLTRHLQHLAADPEVRSACLSVLLDLPAGRRDERDLSVMQQQADLRRAFSGREDGDHTASLAWDTVSDGYLGMWATCEHLKNAYDSMRAEVDRLHAGEDDTPLPDGEHGTAGQWLYRLNRMTADHRHQWLRQVEAWQAEAVNCWLYSHVGQIDGLRRERDRALDEVRELSSRPTRHAYEAACEALEKRRVALAEALGVPDEGFYQAVALAGRLAQAAPLDTIVAREPRPDDDLDEHRVAVVVFATLRAVDPSDAAAIAEVAVKQALRTSSIEHPSLLTITAKFRNNERRPVHIHEVREVHRAAGAGFLHVHATSRAYREIADDQPAMVQVADANAALRELAQEREDAPLPRAIAEPTDLDTDATVVLPAAAAQAAPQLTAEEARNVAATVLRALSELIDEDTTDEGWPDADDLVVLAARIVQAP